MQRHRKLVKTDAVNSTGPRMVTTAGVGLGHGPPFINTMLLPPPFYFIWKILFFLRHRKTGFGRSGQVTTVGTVTPESPLPWTLTGQKAVVAHELPRFRVQHGGRLEGLEAVQQHAGGQVGQDAAQEVEAPGAQVAQRPAQHPS